MMNRKDSCRTARSTSLASWPVEEREQTLGGEVVVAGVGLHSGRNVSMRLCPAEEGITFCVPGRAGRSRRIRATPDAVRDTSLCVVLGDGEGRVATVEHLMSALAGMGITSCDVVLDGPEVPILDGSALPFVELIGEVGREPLDRERYAWEVTRPVTVTIDATTLTVLPDTAQRVSYTIDFSHPAIGKGSASLEVDPSTYREEIAPARTFGFLAEVEWLRSQGLALGGHLDNALVVGERGLVNPPLRFPDEFVRHKILDAIGDLYLLGAPLIGHVCAYRGSHRAHVLLAQELVRQGALRRVPLSAMASKIEMAAREEEPAPAPLRRDSWSWAVASRGSGHDLRVWPVE